MESTPKVPSLLNRLQCVLCVVAGIALLATPATAQLQLGPNLHATASGNLSAGYSASFGEATESQHSLNLGADAGVNGYYFAPSLMAFNILPYYNQSRANSSYQSIDGGSGVSSTANFFTGSRFPGSIGLSKDYNSTGTYGSVGTPSFTTHGSGQGYSIGWSALLPGRPTLSASLSGGSGSSEVYGANSHSGSSTRNFNLRSNYHLRGFGLSASYGQSSMVGSVPSFLSGVSGQASNSASHSESFNLAHILPVHGSFSVNFTRSNFSNHYLGRGNSDTTDTLTSNASFRPTRKLSLSMGTNYSDNLAGTLNQEIVSAGGSPITFNLGSSSHSLSMNAGLGYAIANNLGVAGVVTHVAQYYGGSSQGATFMSGTIYYNRRLFNMFTFSATALDTATDAGNGGIGMQGNVNFTRRFGPWNTGASFSYGQEVQTLLVTFTTSYMSYSANVRRRLGQRFTFNSGFNGTHSGISQQTGTTSRGEGYFASLGYGGYSVNGSYSSSSGISVLTANGLSTPGIPTVISPLDQIVFSGTSYSLSVSATPFRKLTVASSYADSRSNTLGSTISSVNLTTSFTSQLRYQYRRMGMMAGYTHFKQGISAGGAPAAGVSSYYVGISRWVNLF